MKCSFCINEAQFKCTCNLPYMCSIHLETHLSIAGMHSFEPFEITLEDSRLKMLKSRIIENIEKIKNCKTDLTLKTRSLIYEIEKLYSKRLRILDSLINDYGDFLQHSKFCHSERAKIREIEGTDKFLINIRIEDIKDKINRAYSEQIFNNSYEFYNYEDYLFKNTEILDIISVKNEIVKVKVYKSRCPLLNDFVAIKEAITFNREDLEPFLKEADCYKLLSGESQNFLKYYGQRLSIIELGDSNKYKFEIMMEIVEKSLKDDKIDRMEINKPYSEDEIKHIYDQLIESFNIMRQKNIFHCDIKPSNILVTSDLTIKIIDFNIARTTIQEYTQYVGPFGTLDFMAPEIRISNEKNCMASLNEDKADVFSLGMTILFLLLDKPEQDLNLIENRNRLMELIENIKYTWLKNILKKMLEFDYRARASLQILISAHVLEKNRSITVDV